MPTCPSIAKCPFFNGTMAHAVPAVVDSMKNRYCLGSNNDCARWLVFKALGPGQAPDTLAPNMVQAAEALIQAKTGAKGEGG